MAKAKLTIIDTQVYNAFQSWFFVRVLKVQLSTRLKVEIRRNAYDEQSYARVSKWDGDKWQLVNDLPISTCDCKSVSYVQGNITANSFESDYEKLIKVAMEIIS